MAALAATAVEEFAAVQEGDFGPAEPRDIRHIISGGTWRHFYLKHLNGTWDEANCAICRATCAGLRGAPEIEGPGWAKPKGSAPRAAQGGAVGFLRLEPGAHLRLHTGPNNYKLLVHVGVEVTEANEVINFTIAKICVDTAESEPCKI